MNHGELIELAKHNEAMVRVLFWWLAVLTGCMTLLTIGKGYTIYLQRKGRAELDEIIRDLPDVLGSLKEYINLSDMKRSESRQALIGEMREPVKQAAKEGVSEAIPPTGSVDNLPVVTVSDAGVIVKPAEPHG